MVGCTRSSLNVVASEKGVVVGRMKFRDDGDLIDCTKMGVGGKVIPSLIDRVSDIEVWTNGNTLKCIERFVFVTKFYTFLINT